MGDADLDCLQKPVKVMLSLQQRILLTAAIDVVIPDSSASSYKLCWALRAHLRQLIHTTSIILTAH